MQSATIIFDSSKVEGVNLTVWDDPRLITPEKTVPLTGIIAQTTMNVPACVAPKEEEAVGVQDGDVDGDEDNDGEVSSSLSASFQWHDPLSPPSTAPTAIEPDPSLRPNGGAGGARAIIRR